VKYNTIHYKEKQKNNCSAQHIIGGSVNRLVDNYTFKSVKDYQLQTASFVRELVLLRDSTLELSNSVNLSRSEFDQLVHVVSTS
jgi:hypothetical protein